MIAEAFAVLIHYGVYLLPGLILFGLWFVLTPKTVPGMRIVILLLACGLVRLRYGVVAATATHGTAILLIAVPMV